MEQDSDSFCLHHIHAEIMRSARTESCMNSDTSLRIFHTHTHTHTHTHPRAHNSLHVCESEPVELMLNIYIDDINNYSLVKLLNGSVY